MNNAAQKKIQPEGTGRKKFGRAGLAKRWLGEGRQHGRHLHLPQTLKPYGLLTVPSGPGLGISCGPGLWVQAKKV